MRPIPGIVAALFVLSASSCTGKAEEPAPVHPGFSLTREGLESMISPLSEPIRSRISERPEYFLELTGKILDGPWSRHLLVDKNHPLEPDYVPGDLVPLDRYPIDTGRSGLELSADALPDLAAMSTAARLAGLRLVVSSAYRSYAYQDTVYRRIAKEIGTEAADRESARPGRSQHQLGTAVDFGSITDAFASTAEGRWLAYHAWEFGFTMSYPQGAEELTGYRYESWHFRYVGRDAARLEHEFFGGMQQIMLVFLDEKRTILLDSRK